LTPLRQTLTDLKSWTTMKKVGILYHPRVKKTQVKAAEVQQLLNVSKTDAWLCSAWDRAEAQSRLPDTDLIITIGGDGTILRAAQMVIPTTIPITGINMGNLGFNTELRAEETADKLPALLAGEGWIDERSLLEAEIVNAEKPGVFHALNDVVLARGADPHVVSIDASIDDQHLTTYRADGVITATATGSTGYALAAGGPIIHPQSPDILLLPLVPHLSTAYAMVLPSTATVKLHATSNSKTTLSIDGHINLNLDGGATVLVRHSPHTIRFLRIHPRASFYGSLAARLKGKN